MIELTDSPKKPVFTSNEWRPEPKQELFLSIPTTVKEAFYGGGAGSVENPTYSYSMELFTDGMSIQSSNKYSCVVHFPN